MATSFSLQLSGPFDSAICFNVDERGQDHSSKPQQAHRLRQGKALDPSMKKKRQHKQSGQNGPWWDSICCGFGQISFRIAASGQGELVCFASWLCRPPPSPPNASTFPRWRLLYAGPRCRAGTFWIGAKFGVANGGVFEKTPQRNGEHDPDESGGTKRERETERETHRERERFARLDAA